MLKEIRIVRKTNPTKAKSIYRAISKGEMKQHINSKGYLCYDTEEYKILKAQKPRVGRPPKIKKGE